MATTLTFNVLGHDVSGKRTLDEFGRHADQTSSKVGSSFKKMGGMIAGAFTGAAVTSFLHSSIEEATESQKVGAQTAAVLKSTRGESNMTATSIGNLATAISNKAGIDDEAIQSGENLLLTFTNIRNEAGKGNDIFSQTSKIMTDMSVATGSDMKSSAMALGKALNDPIAGMSRLSKVGVTFTDQQKAQVAAMVKTGDTMGAQRVILGELNKEFGGSAAAQATPAEKAQVAWGNLQETIGTKLLPVLGRLANFATNDLIPALYTTGHWIQQNEAWLKPLVITVGALMAAWKLHSLATAAMTAINTKMDTLRSQFGRTAVAAETSAGTVAEAEAAETRAVLAASTEQQAALARLSGARQRAAAVAVESAATSTAAGGGVGRVGGAGLVGGGVVGGAGAGARGLGSRLGRGAMIGAGLAIGGTIVGDAVGSGASKTSGRSVAGSTLKAAGYGAAAGATIGSVVPGLGTLVGGAIGGVGGAAIGFTKAFIGMKNAQDAAARSSSAFDRVLAGERSTISGFAKDVLVGGDALRRNQQATAAAAASRSGLTSKAAAAGLTEKDLTNAITGSQQAYDKVVAAWRDSGTASQDNLLALSKLRDEFDQGQQAARVYADSHGVAIKSELRHGSELDLLKGKLGQFGDQTVTARQQSRTFSNSVDDVTRSVRANGRTLDANTSFGQKNIAAIRTATAQAVAHAQAVYRQTGSLKKADDALHSDRAKLLDAAHAAGLNRGQVRKLSDALARIPKNPHSKVTVDTAAARRAVTGFSSWYDNVLNRLSQKVVQPTVSSVGNTGTGLLSVPGYKAPGHNAQGTGYWRGGASVVGEYGPEVLDLPVGSKVTPTSIAESQNRLGSGGDTYNVTISLPNAFMTQAEVDRAVASAVERAVGRGQTLNIARGVR